VRVLDALKAQILAHARVWIRALGLPVLVLAVASVAGAQVSPVKQDSYVVAGSVDNFGGADNIFVDDATNAEGLVQFDLSSLPLSTTANNVVKASILLYVNKVSAPGSISIAEANGY
jgi:hypothetical protein